MSTSPKRSLKRTCAGVSAGALALTGFAAGFAAAATSASATQSFTFSRLAGSDRFGTAAAIATNTFPGGAATVLIANGDTGHFPDALSGNYLAGQDGAPILLTHVDTLPTATSDALTALKAKNVVILGQTSAVGSTVEADLKAKGYSVTRVGGVDRYATARDISESKGATAVGSVGSSGPTALLASGQNFPDALVAGPLGYAGKLPVEITDPNTLSSATQTALQDLKIKNVIIAGGDTAVSQGVENQVKGLNGGITITRLSGVSRTETATTIADYAVKNLGFSNKHVNLARSDDFPDALTGGPHAGAEKSPIILANDPNTLGTAAGDWLKANSGTLTDGHIFGGPSAVSNAVQSEATKDAQGTSGATVSSSNSTIAPGGTATISVKGAQPNTALTFSVPANCGTVSPTNPTTDASGNTSSTFTASSTASGSCTITVKDASGNTVGTSTVTVTPAASNQTINVQPTTAATQNTGTYRQYTASGLDNTKTYSIELFGCSNTSTSNGQSTFTGTNPGGTGNSAQQGNTNGNTITVINGTTPQSSGSGATPGTQFATSPQNGTVTFTVQNGGVASCVTPVVYQDTNNNGALDLNANGTPSEPFGQGGSVTFINPAQAGTFGGGAGTAQPSSALTTSPTGNTFTTSAGTFQYGPNDQYQLFNQNAFGPSCVNTTYADFQNRLTQGDSVGGNYQPGGTSTFCLNDSNPVPPSYVNVTPNTGQNTANNTSTGVNQGGETVSFPDSLNTAVTSYNVYRAAATAPTTIGGSYSCPTVYPTATPGGTTGPGTSPQVAPASPYTVVGSVTDTSTPSTTTAGGAGQIYYFNDTAATPGTNTAQPNEFCYAVSSLAPNGAGSSQVGTGQTAGSNSTTANGTNTPAPTTGAPTAAASTAPSFTQLVQTSPTTAIAYYNQPILLTSCDTTASTPPAPPFDYSAVTSNGNGTNNAQTITQVACANGTYTYTPTGGTATTVTNGGQATITFSAPLPTGQTLFVTSQNGADGNTVGGTTTPTQYQPVGQTVQTTATQTAPTLQSASGSAAAHTISTTFNQNVVYGTVGNLTVYSDAACTTLVGPATAFVSGAGTPTVTATVAGVTAQGTDYIKIASGYVASAVNGLPNNPQGCTAVTVGA